MPKSSFMIRFGDSLISAGVVGILFSCVSHAHLPIFLASCTVIAIGTGMTRLSRR